MKLVEELKKRRVFSRPIPSTTRSPTIRVQGARAQLQHSTLKQKRQGISLPLFQGTSLPVLLTA
jgi:hypothetical protein